MTRRLRELPRLGCRLATVLLVVTVAVLSGAAPRSEALSVTSLYVDDVYVDMLQRRAEALGHRLFMTAIDHGVLSHAAMAGAVVGSVEYQGRLLEAYYETLLHRHSDVVGRTGFTGALAAGVRDETVIAALLGSTEYHVTRGGGHDSHFLDALFADVLQRGLGDDDRIRFLQILASGVSRDTVALSVVNSVEARAAFVERCYQNLLHRGSDAVGRAGFMAALGAGASHESVVAAIAGSPEYLSKVGTGSAGSLATFGPCAPIALESLDGLIATQSSLDPLVGIIAAQEVDAQSVDAPPTLVLLAALGMAGLTVRGWRRRGRTTDRA